MDYVDKKFENLESLIKKNHSQLMESRHREDNQPLKDVVGKPLTCTVEVSEQKGNVDPQSSTFQFDKQPSSPIQIDLADEVDVSVNEDDEADQAPQDINEVTMNENGVDTVQHNIRQFVPDTVTVDTSWVTKGLLKTHANNTYERYYNSHADDVISTEEHVDRASVVSAHERSIINIIKGFSMPAGLSWHLVDNVYISINCDGQFHWVLAVVELKNRDCGLYVATFAEYLNDQFEIPLDGFLPEYLRNRYGALLWTYGSKKAKGGYVSENNDPPKPKGLVTPPPEENLVHTN
uniref:Ulp1 protease family, C-terminal catalytic domain containing protein n=1 Tax=Solanum tuberosum TaxID=4113 RepID=M1DHU5_SOLTU